MPDSMGCHPSIGSSVDSFQHQLFPIGNGGVPDVHRLLGVGLALQSKLLLPILAGTGPAFMTGTACLVALLRLIKRRPGESPPSLVMLKRCAIFLLWLSTAGSIASALATTMTTAALEYSLTDLHDASFTIRRGIPVMCLQWTLALLLAMLSGMAWFIVRSAGASAPRIDDETEFPYPKDNGPDFTSPPYPPF